jgi:hypothetical protein
MMGFYKSLLQGQSQGDQQAKASNHKATSKAKASKLKLAITRDNPPR